MLYYTVIVKLAGKAVWAAANPMTRLSVVGKKSRGCEPQPSQWVKFRHPPITYHIELLQGNF